MVSIDWKSLGGRFRLVSANLGGVWGISDTGDVFYRIGTYENAQKPGTGWWQVEGTTPGLPNHPQLAVPGQGKLKHLSVGWNVVWAVDHQGKVWYREGIDIEHVVGLMWVQVPSHVPFKQISVDRLGHVWGVDARHEVYFRVGACLGNKGGNFWKKMGDRRMSHVDVGKSGVWGADENMEIFYRPGTYGENGSEGSDWVKVGPDTVLLHQVTAGGQDMMVGVTRKGEPFMRTGMSCQNPTGTHWKRLQGQLCLVDMYGYMAWAIDSNMEPVFSSCLPFSQPAIKPLRDSHF